jgi:hypothetical protein
MGKYLALIIAACIVCNTTLMLLFRHQRNQLRGMLEAQIQHTRDMDAVWDSCNQGADDE